MPTGQSDGFAELERRRADAETRLIAVDAELQASKSYSAADDRPATLAEIRDQLKPGEVYFKLTEIRNYAFGMLVDKEGYKIFRVARPMVEVSRCRAGAWVDRWR
jgi:hypothetical protein